MRVPLDLKSVIGWVQVKFSLKTDSVIKARAKAISLAGFCQYLFNTLRADETIMKLDMTEIQRIVNSAIRRFLD